MSASTLLAFYRMKVFICVQEHNRLWDNTWKFLGFTPLFDPPRHNSAATIKSAPNFGKSIKRSQVVALTHLLPANDSEDELDSYMYQTTSDHKLQSSAQYLPLTFQHQPKRAYNQANALNNELHKTIGVSEKEDPTESKTPYISTFPGNCAANTCSCKYESK
nr:plasma membrane H+-ATPase [Tanacetum cinerariifolium]